MPDPTRRTLLTTLALAGGLGACANRSSDTTPARPRYGGRFVDYRPLASKEVAPRQVRVWLPPAYDAGRQRHAVLYMQDGQTVFDPPSDPLANAAWDADRHLLALASENAIRPTIVVAIWNAGMDRAREYGPQAPIEALPAALRRLVPHRGDDAAAAPGADAYLRFLVHELKPFIDATYRTRPGPEDTVVMGSSMGGLISLYALASYPLVFGAAGCLSTHWVMTTNYAAFMPRLDAAAAPDPRVEQMALAYRNWLRLHLPRAGSHRLYFDHGTAELDALYGAHQVQVDALVAARGYRQGVDWMTQVFPGAAHNQKAWSARLQVPLRFLLRA